MQQEIRVVLCVTLDCQSVFTINRRISNDTMKEIITQKPTQKPKPLPTTKRVRKPIALPNSGDQYCRITPIILKVLVLVFIATIYFCQIHIIKRGEFYYNLLQGFSSSNF